MITSSQQDRDLPFLPTLLCLWGAGFVTSLVTSFLFLGRLYSPSSQSPVMVAVNLLLSAAIGAVVVQYLLLTASRRVRVFDDPHAGNPTASAYSELISAVRESALGLVGAVNSIPPDSVPTVIADGLLPYEAVIKRLQQAELPSAVSPELNQRLLRGLRQLEEDPILTAEEAATTAGTRLYQRGLLTARTVDVSDGGGRFRWELEQSEVCGQ